ncbi:hypothetical protein FB451DRAFT_1174751 [Mycena latifolia]|nr:hypothetical protein FB451DRAFT_1174751 [Mycena latifolia]
MFVANSKRRMFSRRDYVAAERRRVIQDLDSIVYPVLTLPPEITAHVFSFYGDSPHLGRTSDQGLKPLLLASVCRDWRNICLSVGSLSTHIRIQVYIADILRHISLLAAVSDSQIPFDAPIFLLEYGASRAHPVLEYFTDQQLDPGAMLTAFSDAPSLREAQLSGASLQCISLLWIQLTHLGFSYQPLSARVDILRHTTNLEILCLHITPSQDAADSSSTPVHLPKLHTLKFSNTRGGMLLGYLTLPALRSLELTSLTSLNLLLQLCLRSAWSLRSIRLTSISNTAALILCLRSIPSLEDVNTEWPDSNWSHLIVLLAQDDAFLPALRVLTLSAVVDNIPSMPLVEMLGVSKLAYTFRVPLVTPTRT